MERLRRRLPARRDAGALHRLQPARSSSATCSTTARDLGAEALATGHYVPPRQRRGRPRAASRRRSGARPELFPVRHHAASSSTSCASRSAACPRARRARSPSASTCRSPTSPTARTSASCPTATMPGRAEAAARGARAGRHRRHGRPRGRPPRRHRALHRRPAPRPGARHRAAPTTIRSMSCGSSPRRAASSSARARRSAAARSRSTTSTGSAPAPRRRCRCRCGCAPRQALRPGRARAQRRRRGRALRRARDRRLARPGLRGLRCAPTGSRVLGGGFIRRFAS